VTTQQSSLIDRIDASFAELSARGSASMTIDGRAIGHGFPDRPIRLDELKALLLHPAVSPHGTDAALAILVHRARTLGGDWRVALLGVLTPGIATRVGLAARGYPGDSEDLAAEVVAGVLAKARRIHLGGDGLAGRLLGGGLTCGRDLARRERRRRAREAAVASGTGSGADPADNLLGATPEAVLDLAAAMGAISRADARLIRRTRLEGVAPWEAAHELRITTGRVYRRRAQAERSLAAWLDELKRAGA